MKDDILFFKIEFQLFLKMVKFFKMKYNIEVNFLKVIK